MERGLSVVEAIEVVAAVHVGDHHGVAHVAVGAVAPRAESVGSGKKGKQWEINFTCHLEIMGRGAELEFQTLQQHGKQFFFSIRLLIHTIFTRITMSRIVLISLCLV